jgi:hypothetical protein
MSLPNWVPGGSSAPKTSPYVQHDNVTEFHTGSGLSDHQMHAIAHTNVEALLRI